MKRRVMALFLALTMLVGMAPAVFAADTGFSDVAADAWYAEAVKWAVDNNITGGIGNGMFGPDNTCTRGQVVTFLWAAAGKPVMENADNPFSDVKESDWYYNAVMWAVSNNITGGTSATTFSPEAPCTRAAVVTFLYAAEGKPAVENAKNDFVDVGSGDWFYAPVMWAVANNITGGIGNGCFGPDNACTRGQIALFLYKASLIGGGDAPDVTPTPEIMNVKDAEDAIAQLAAADSGYENALSELTEKSTNTIEGDSYYRLQQNYKGIPVYGRTVVCATDENGDVMAVTGNVADVDEAVDLTPTVTVERVEAAIETYLIRVYGINDSVSVSIMTDKELVIYVNDEGTSALAYALTAYVGDEPYEIIVDADTGMVYAMQSLVRTETIQRTYTLGDDEKPVKVNFWHENGTYFMDDHERNIQFYSAGGDALCCTLVYYDADNQPMYYYFADSKQWKNAKQEKIDSPQPFTYERVEWEFFANDEMLNVAETTSKENKLPQDLCDVMISVACADDIFAERFGRSGWTNDRDRSLSVAYNCGNSSYAFCAEGLGMLSLETGAGLDEIAHEFAHTVEQSESTMAYKNESGAIMEALSDIFGELAEYHYYTECDWMLDGGLRNLADPSQSTEDNTPHPSEYMGDHWQYSADDHGGVHQNSTVISHAAYLMSTDGDGKLSMDELGELWYRAMLMMPSDCDFYTCRRLVELAGVNMELDNDQMECISRAFDEVDIKPQVEINGYDLYNLHPEGSLNVFGIDGELYGNYITVLTLVPYFDGELSIDGIYNLYPKWGLYYCELFDVADSEKTKEFYINITYYQDNDHIDIQTDFGGVLVMGSVKEITFVNGVQFMLPVEGASVTVYSKLSNKPVKTAIVEDINKGFNLTLPAGEYYLEASADGYITNKKDFTVGTDDIELDIILEPAEADNSDAYAAYVPVVERAIRDTKNAMYEFAVDDSQWTQGYLEDLDGDGIDELLMCYYYQRYGDDNPYTVYSVYDYEGGELKTVVDRGQIVEQAPPGFVGYAAVVTFDGKLMCLTVDEEGYGSGPASKHLYTYRFYEYPSMELAYSLAHWQREMDMDVGLEELNTFYINGEETTKEGFLSGLDRCEELQFGKSHWEDFYIGDPMSLRELMKMLTDVEYECQLIDRSYYEDGVLRVEYSYNKAVLLNETEAAKAINAAIDRDAEAFLKEYNEESLKKLAQHPYIADGGSFTCKAESVVSNSVNDVLSILISKTVQLGGNGNPGSQYALNYDLTTGEPVVLTDVFNMDEKTLTEKLKSSAWAYLSEHHSQALFDDARDTIYDYTLDEFIYFFEDGELYLIFNPYTIASGAAGSFVVPTGMILS